MRVTGTGRRDEAAVACYLGGLAKFGWHLGLERVEALLTRIGSPQRGLRFVHVAGTNGKGSTSAAIANILAAAGLKVGLYTSPHLESHTERVVIQSGPTRAGDPTGLSARQEIPARRLYELLIGLEADVQAVAQEAEVGTPTEFEVLTTAALRYFAEARVDVVVLETGLGGRLDATNVVLPEVAVITHIALDHLDRLGPDLPSIAAEKAGIIKPGRPVVIGPQDPTAQAVLLEAAARRNAPAHLVLPEVGELPAMVGRSTVYNLDEISSAGCRFEAETRVMGHERRARLSTPLLGRHQAVNGAVAVAAAMELSAQGWPITESAIAEGLGGTWWPGRGEVVRRRPQAIVDGALNPDGMRTLADLLTTVFAGKRRIGVVGFLGDKAFAEMSAILAPCLDQAFITKPESDRAADVEAVRSAMEAAGCPSTVIATPSEAARVALNEATDDELLVGCGSLYLIGELRRTWEGGKV
jgi:dihydrofolate synthase/folylpolyglutamate synthase